jgi:hypothetical protein
MSGAWPNNWLLRPGPKDIELVGPAGLEQADRRVLETAGAVGEPIIPGKRRPLLSDEII